MAVIQLIVVLVVIGVLLWAMNYILAEYIQPNVLAIINKIAIVAIVLYVLIWLLSLVGLIPPVTWWEVRRY